MSKQRISYVDPATVSDPAMIAEFERCAKFGTPRPESQAIRAHVPPVMMAFADAWRNSFHEGVCDHNIKELCRVYVSRAVKCEYCGNQRSEKSRNAGLVEADFKDLLNFEKSTRYGEREKAALAYAEAITWDIETDDALWDRLHANFTEPELVELGFFIALTMGQQRWLRTLGLKHRQVLDIGDASLAPGVESAAVAKSTNQRS